MKQGYRVRGDWLYYDGPSGAALADAALGPAAVDWAAAENVHNVDEHGKQAERTVSNGAFLCRAPLTDAARMMLRRAKPAATPKTEETEPTGGEKPEGQ